MKAPPGRGARREGFPIRPRTARGSRKDPVDVRLAAPEGVRHQARTRIEEDPAARGRDQRPGDEDARALRRRPASEDRVVQGARRQRRVPRQGASRGLRRVPRGGAPRPEHAALRRAAHRRHRSAPRDDLGDEDRRGQDPRRDAPELPQRPRGQGRAHRHGERLPRHPRLRVDGAHPPLAGPRGRRRGERPERARQEGRLPRRHHLRPEQRVRLRLPARQHEDLGLRLRAAGPELRHRRRGRLDPHRRGAHAAHHLGPGRDEHAPLRRRHQGDPVPAQGRALRRRREGALGGAHRRGHRRGAAPAQGRQPLRPHAHRGAAHPAAVPAGAHALQARRELHGERRRRGAHHRRVHGPRAGGSSLERRPPPGRRGEGARAGARREPHHGDDHVPEPLPALQEAVGHDRHGGDRGRGAAQDLQARRPRDPDEPGDPAQGLRRPRLQDRAREVQGGGRGDRRQRGARPAVAGGHGLRGEERGHREPAAQARHQARGAQREAARARGVHRRAGGPQGLGHRGHEHGRPRHRHHPRRQPRDAREGGDDPRAQGPDGGGVQARARGPRRDLQGALRQGARGGRRRRRPAHHRHRAPRVATHRQPAPRPRGAPGRSRQLAVLPLPRRRPHAHLRRRAGAVHHGPPRHGGGRAHRAPVGDALGGERAAQGRGPQLRPAQERARVRRRDEPAAQGGLQAPPRRAGGHVHPRGAPGRRARGRVRRGEGLGRRHDQAPRRRDRRDDAALPGRQGAAEDRRRGRERGLPRTDGGAGSVDARRDGGLRPREARRGGLPLLRRAGGRVEARERPQGRARQARGRRGALDADAARACARPRRRGHRQRHREARAGEGVPRRVEHRRPRVALQRALRIPGEGPRVRRRQPRGAGAHALPSGRGALRRPRGAGRARAAAPPVQVADARRGRPRVDGPPHEHGAPP